MPRGLTPRDIQNIQSDVLICNNIISLIIVLQSNPAFKNDTYILQDIKESISVLGPAIIIVSTDISQT